MWYAGNRNGRIGRLNPADGAIKTIMTGEAKDPHTMVFDGKGHIWFTSQGSNRVGRLNIASEKVDLITPFDTPSNLYWHRYRHKRHRVGRAAPRWHDCEDRSEFDGGDAVQGKAPNPRARVASMC